MTVVFMAVDERDAQDIRNIVGRYGKLNMKPADNSFRRHDKPNAIKHETHCYRQWVHVFRF